MKGLILHRLTGLGGAVVLLLAASASALDSLAPTLAPYLKDYGLPALAAAVVKDGEIIAAGALGTRRAGNAIPVTLDDRFHIGSDTKAMTALLAAMLVEQGKLQWTTTVAEVFPELADTMDTRLRGVTLRQLLSHTSGLPPDNEAFIKLLADSLRPQPQPGNLDDLRYGLVKAASLDPLAAEPGAQFAYANLGYLFVGAIIERRTGKTWEELISERVFDPLGLSTAGLGPQATMGRVDAPLGHAIIEGVVKPMLAGPDGDNPALLGPAGTAHLSVLDFARWAGWNAGEGRRGPHLVTPEMLKTLHTAVVTVPEDGSQPAPQYALGWGVRQPPWAPNPVLIHAGSNRMNYAVICVDPRRDFAVVAMTNIASERAEPAMTALIQALFTHFSGAGPAASPL
jgi:CubicO group peptidase (beta-lactamase class C family)